MKNNMAIMPMTVTKMAEHELSYTFKRENKLKLLAALFLQCLKYLHDKESASSFTLHF